MNLQKFYDELSQVKWNQFEDAYGESEDIPQIIMDLLSSKKEEREEAQGAMYSHLCHQGSVYSATVEVIPFLFQMFQIQEIPTETRLFLLEFLKDVGGLSRNQYEEIRQDYSDSDDFAVYQKYAKGFPLYLQILQEGSLAEKILAIRLLGSVFSEQKELLPKLTTIVDQSKEPVFWATALFSVSQLGGEQAVLRLKQELSSKEPWKKICAALALCSCLGEKAPKEVIPILLEGLDASKEIEAQYEQVPWSDWPLKVEIAAALSIWGPGIGDHVLPQLLKKFPELEPMSATAMGRYMLALSLGNGELPFSSLWPDVLMAIANHQKFWTFNVNAHEVLDDWNLRPEDMESDETWQKSLRDLALSWKEDPKRDQKMQDFLHREVDENFT